MTSLSLNEGLQSIRKQLDDYVSALEHRGSKTSLSKDLIDAYDIVWKLCTQRGDVEHSAAMYTAFGDSVQENIRLWAVPLLDKAKVSADSHELLRAWVTRFTNFSSFAHFAAGVFMYLDRFHVPMEKLPPLRTKAFSLYEDLVFRVYRNEVVQVVLQCIQKERQQEPQDRILLSQTTRVFLDLGAAGKRNLYEFLEDAILKNSAFHYERLSRIWIEEDSLTQYIEKTNRCLQDEMTRADVYLAATTRDKLYDRVHEQLVQERLDRLLRKQSGVAMLIEEKRVDQLQRIYRLLIKYPACMDLFAGLVNEYVAGAVQKVVDRVQPNGEPSDPQEVNPEQVGMNMILALVTEHERFQVFCEESFRNDFKMQSAIVQAFDLVLNKDYRVSKLLARFLNELMKKGSVVKLDDLDGTLNTIVLLYGYLRDKDVFENEYQQYLARRLLTGMSESEPRERQMLDRLKSRSGKQWIQKLEGMFKDMNSSKELIDEFKKVYDPEEKEDFSLSVSVCKSGFWPAVNRSAPCHIPLALKPACQAFTDFFCKKFSNRILTWRFDDGQADVQISFPPDKNLPNGSKHTLVVTTYQMLILMVFNEEKVPTLQRLVDSTGIPMEDIGNHLLTLVHPRHGFLMKKPPGKELSPSDQFKLNSQFNEQLRALKRINVPLMQIVKNQPVIAGPDSSTLMARQLLVDAAIVRIMKIRRSFSYQLLMNEVALQLQTRFQAQPPLVKKRIDALIEQEYIKRDETDRNILLYIA